MIARGSGVADGTEASAFTDWLRPHWPAMFRLATRLAGRNDAEDVLQEAVGSAWRKRGQFDPARGTPSAWLLAIVADQSAKNHRRRRSTVELADHVAPESSSDPDLAAAVGRLPSRQRQAVELYYYLGLPVAEVAAVMACAEGTVKSTLSAARAGLRTMLEEQA